MNYTVPFAHRFRTANRLGFDLFQIHVWDTEISDEFDNLKENEHLDAFDYYYYYYYYYEYSEIDEVEPTDTSIELEDLPF